METFSLTNKKILIIGIIYILSCIGAYHYIQNYFYGKNPPTMVEKVTPDMSDIVIVFLPLANTVLGLLYITEIPNNFQPKETDFFKP